MAADIGFGGFLEKFEDHFGRTATKIFLVIIGVTIVSVCGATIWTQLLKPLAIALPDPRPGGNAYELGKLVTLGALFLWLVNMMLNFADNYLARKLRVRLRAGIDEARAIAKQGEEKLQRAQEMVDRSSNILAAADLALEDILTHALETNLITEQQAQELIALKDDPSANENPEVSS